MIVPSTGLYRSLSRLLARRREIRATLRTERVLNALPRDIRRDIGWPDIWQA